MSRANYAPSRSECIRMMMTLAAGAWLIVLAAVVVFRSVLSVIGGAS